MLVAAVWPAGVSAVAQEPHGTVDRSEALAMRCVSCHQPGAASDAMPAIAGRPQAELAAKLRGYRASAQVKNVMATRASGLSDEDIDDLARHFAAEPRAGHAAD